MSTFEVLQGKSNPSKADRRSFLTESVYKVVLQISTSAQIRQLALFISINEGPVDGFV